MFAVYEYEPGGTLGDLQKDALLTIPLEERLRLFEQLCDAVQAAHSESLIHRDIKPDNILITSYRKRVMLYTIQINSKISQ